MDLTTSSPLKLFWMARCQRLRFPRRRMRDSVSRKSILQLSDGGRQSALGVSPVTILHRDCDSELKTWKSLDLPRRNDIHKRFCRSTIKSHIRDPHYVRSRFIGVHKDVGVKCSRLKTNRHQVAPVETTQGRPLDRSCSPCGLSQAVPPNIVRQLSFAPVTL